MILSIYRNTIVFVAIFVIAIASDSSNVASDCSGNGNDFEKFLLNAAGSLIKEAIRQSSCKVSCMDPDSLLNKPMDCADILETNMSTQTGVHKIWPRNRISKGSVSVYCDMDDDGGGWTVIQRRGDFDSAKDYFFKDWNSYKNGFGDLLKDFWIGNDNIFALTNQRANLVKFVLTDWEGNKTHATFDDFWIDDEQHKFTMHVNGYRGTAGDSFSGTNDVPFTTKDRDNDKHESNCANMFKGAWWYTSCHSSNLNGYYLKGPHESHADGVEWHTFRGHYYSLKDTFIKIRPKEFPKSNNINSPAASTSDVLEPTPQ